MFKALLKKELKEHFPLAAIGFVAGVVSLAVHIRPISLIDMNVYSAGVWRMLASVASSLHPYERLPVPIVSPAYLGKLALISYVLALGLGVSLTWKEEIKKTWAFLLHRPVTRGQLLGVKLCAGIGLFLSAVTIPYLLFALWSFIPGKYPAPWCRQFLYPGIEIIVRGCAVFLGSFLMGLRKGRWYGSRILPLAGTALLLVASGWSHTWSMTAVWFLVIFLILATAISHEFLKFSRLRPALVVIVSLGVAALFVVVEMTVKSIGRRNEAEEPFCHLQVSKTGDIQLVTSDGNRGTLKTPEGQIIAEGLSYGDERIIRNARLRRPESTWPRPWKPGERGSPVWRLTHSVAPNAPITYLLGQENRLVEYDWRTRKIIGYWSSDGFVQGTVKPGPFPKVADAMCDDFDDVIYVSTQEGLFGINGKSRTVTLRVPGAFFSAGTAAGNTVADRKDLRVYARGPTTVTVCLPDGSSLLSFALPVEARDAWTIEVRKLDGDLLGLIRDDRFGWMSGDVKGDQPNVCAYVLRPSGEVIRKYSTRLPYSYWHYTRSPTSAFTVLAPAFSLLHAGGAWAITHSFGSPWAGKSIFSEMNKPALAWLLLLAKSLVCAVAVALILRGRSMALSAQAGWSLLAFLGGIPAFVGIWLVVAAERKVPCPACGAGRLPSASHCPRCRVGWPRPEHRDTDIFS